MVQGQMVTNGHSSSLSLSSRGTPQGKNALEAGSRSEAIVKGKLSGTSCYERKCIQMCFLTSPLWLPLTHVHTHTHTPNSGWESDLFSPFSLLFLLFGSRKWFSILWTTVQTHLTVTCATAHSSLCTWQFVCHAWQECARMIRASHFCGLQVQGSKKQNHDRYEPWSVVSCSSHHIEEVLQLAFSAISTLARWRLMSFTDNTEWDCGGR